MSYIESEDYTNKRIYLHADTVSLPKLDFSELYREHLNRRKLNVSGERRFNRMVLMIGNDPAGADFTPKYVDLQQDVRLVPYDVSHRPLIGPTALISRSESLAGRDLFDRTSLSSGVEVDIDYQPEKTGFTEVNTGSGLTTAQATAIAEIHTRLGLDATKPLTNKADGGISATGINITAATSGTDIIQTRQ